MLQYVTCLAFPAGLCLCINAGAGGAVRGLRQRMLARSAKLVLGCATNIILHLPVPIRCVSFVQARAALIAGLRQRMLARTAKLVLGYAEGEPQPQLGPGDPSASQFNNPGRAPRPKDAGGVAGGGVPGGGVAGA